MSQNDFKSKSCHRKAKFNTFTSSFHPPLPRLSHLPLLPPLPPPPLPLSPRFALVSLLVDGLDSDLCSACGCESESRWLSAVLCSPHWRDEEDEESLGWCGIQQEEWAFLHPWGQCFHHCRQTVMLLNWTWIYSVKRCKTQKSFQNIELEDFVITSFSIQNNL